MKKVILKKITLTNWKGQDKEVSFGDTENVIYGRNKTGKTSLFKAFCWLLTGYADANTSKNSDLFDNKKVIDKDTPIAAVSAIVSIDGVEYKLSRSAQAKFVRKRGTQDYEKSASDEYKYFVDDIEFNASDYEDWLTQNLADSTMLRYALCGEVFITQVFDDKKKARRIIEQIIGKVGEDEMKGSYPIIDGLKDKYTLEQIEEQATNRIKAINEKLDSIPMLVKMRENDLSALKATDFNAVSVRIGEKEKRKESLTKQIFDLSERIKPQLEAAHKAEQSIAMLKSMYSAGEEKYKRMWIDKDNDLVVKISTAEKSNEDAERRTRELEGRKREMTGIIARIDAKLNILRKERDEIKNIDLGKLDVTCPFCGAELDGEKAEEARALYIAQINEKLEGIVVEGKTLAFKKKEHESAIERMKNEKESIKYIDVETLKTQLAELRKTDITPFEETEQGKDLISQIAEIPIPQVTMPDNSEINAELKAIDEELKGLYSTLGLRENIAKYESEIDNLHKQQVELGAELGHYEQQRIEVKKYKQEQMQILSDKVNAGLSSSRIDIWSTQKDGTVVPDLVIKDATGVNYSTTNNASRLLTAIDIQRFFCNCIGINLPTFIDEALIINKDNLPKLDDTQMFYLYCSEHATLQIKSK